MQQIIAELSADTTKDHHIEHLKNEIEKREKALVAKNQTITQLESQVMNSRVEQSADTNDSKLKNVIEEEVKTLCTGLVQRTTETMKPKDNKYMHRLLESADSLENLDLGMV